MSEGGWRLTEQETGHYRILQLGETIRIGDEWWSDTSQSWVPTTLQNHTVGAIAGNTCQAIGNTYRRGLEPEPQPEPQPAICPQPVEHDLSAVRGPTPDELAFHETRTAEIVPAADLRVRIAELETEANRLRAINGDLKIELEQLRTNSAPPPTTSEHDSHRIHSEHIQQRVRDLVGYVRCQAFVFNFDEHVTETMLVDILSELAKNQ